MAIITLVTLAKNVTECCVIMMHFTHPDRLRDDAKALNMDSGEDCHHEGNPKLRNKIVKTKGAIVVAHSEEGCHKALSRCHEWSRDIVTLCDPGAGVTIRQHLTTQTS